MHKKLLGPKFHRSSFTKENDKNPLYSPNLVLSQKAYIIKVYNLYAINEIKFKFLISFQIKHSINVTLL